MERFLERGRELPIEGRYDVVVCGGGPAGLIAAVAASRLGARTLLIERYGFLGGTATAGLMVEFGSIFDGERVLIGGAVHELLHRLAGHGGALLRDERSHSMVFDPESLIAVGLEMAGEARVELLLHTLVTEPILVDNRVAGVVTESKSGRRGVVAKVLIDATGDGDLAARAGAAFEAGREGDRCLQPVTLEVILGNVDTTRIPASHRELLPAISEAAARGEWAIPTEQLFSWGRVRKRGAPDDPRSAFFFINGTNAVGVDGTSARDLTRAEVETLVQFLRQHAPGFEGCYVDRTAAQVGVRETRRITGDYTLSRADVLSVRHFMDGVVPACNSIDVHDVGGKCFEHEYLRTGTHYQIPYRCFLPAGLEGILVTGRCLSADHHALGSARVMVVCMPMGEACGLGAAIAVHRSCTPREIPVQDLRSLLRKRGTVLL